MVRTGTGGDGKDGAKRHGCRRVIVMTTTVRTGGVECGCSRVVRGRCRAARGRRGRATVRIGEHNWPARVAEWGTNARCGGYRVMCGRVGARSKLISKWCGRPCGGDRCTGFLAKLVVWTTLYKRLAANQIQYKRLVAYQINNTAYNKKQKWL
jgi:hypothetical protein